MSKKKFQIGDRLVTAYLNKSALTKLLITPVEAGACVGWSRQTVYNKIHNKDFPIPTIDFYGRKMVVVSDLKKIVEELRIASFNQKPRRPGRPPKEESVRRKIEKNRVEA